MCGCTHLQGRMRLSPRCVPVTSTRGQVTLAPCEQSRWPLGLYHKEQGTQNVGGDRPSHSVSHVRGCGETIASPKEVVDGEGGGPGLLPCL